MSSDSTEQTPMDVAASTPGSPPALLGISWCLVEAGSFLMGSDKAHDPETRSDETPQHTRELPAFYISREPITQDQFRAFVTSGGYRERTFWTDAGWAWREATGISEPESFGGDFSLPDHPVVGVSWHEAIAFCRWLAERAGGEIRLPTEAEWEKAARGADGRVYPWGSEWGDSKANTAELDLKNTTAVGRFPEGASPYGVLDMAGNVWEWCGTLYQPYPYAANDGREDPTTEGWRVLRGGSWSDEHRNARCAFRYGFDPAGRYSDTGFRVVFVPRQ